MGFMFGSFTGIFLFLMALIVPVTMWTDRSLDFWFTYFKGEEVNIPWYLSLLVTVVFNGFILLANLISELFRFAV